jgi:CP family cyanate transporter-like MFS transporter
MRVVVGERHGGPDVLRVTERESPRPGPGEVVVDVAAIGVNYMDIYQREGIGSYRAEPPFVPGGEGAGTVTAVGADAGGLAAGDRVAWAGPGGSYAEQVALPARRAVPVPEGLSLHVASYSLVAVPEYPAADGRRPCQITLLVVAVAAAGLNLRTAITSLPPLFPDLASRLHLSSAALSLLAATPVICFGVVSAFAALLARRFGEEPILLAALGLLTAGLLLRGAAPGPLLFPGTVLASSAIAILNVLLSSMVKRRWPERAGLGVGIYLTALSVGAIVSSLASVPLYRSSGGSVRLALGVWAAPAALAALLWLPQLRHRAGPRAPAASRPAAPAAGLKVYRYALAWQVMAFMGLQSLLYYAALSWLPTIFQDRGASAVTAGNLLALMGVGNLATSLVVPVLAHRSPGQRALVIPSLAGTAVGLAGSVWAPLGTAALWVLVLGVSQGACLGLAIFFMMARAPDPGVAASLSAFGQSAGYLIASGGPLEVGLLHTATGGWGIPVGVLLAITGTELAVGLLAARPLLLPAAGSPEPSTTRVSVTGRSRRAS